MKYFLTGATGFIGGVLARQLRVVAGVTYLSDSAKARREPGFSVRPLEVGLQETLLHEMRLLGLRATPVS